MMVFDTGWGELALFALCAAVAGTVSGVLAGVFGIGGGAVLVPVFYQVFGAIGVPEDVRMHLAVGSSLAVIIPTAVRSYRGHLARGAVDRDLLRSFLLPAPIGVVLASITAAYMSGEGLRIVFALIVLVVGLRLMFNRESWRVADDLPGPVGRSVAGLLIGYLSTLIGIGGGVLNNTFMTLHNRSMHQAVATSSGLGVLISIPGAVGYVWAGWNNPHLPVASTGFVNWIAVALVIPLAIIATPYGVRLAHRLTRRQLEIGFGLFCLVVSARFFASL